MSNKIELSPAWVLGTGKMINRMFTSVDATWAGVKANSGILSASHYNWTLRNTGDYIHGAVLTIMKGVKPNTILELTPQLTLANIDNRSTDKLILYDNGNDAGSDFIVSQTKVNPAIISTSFVPAIATGTATWFWLRSYGGYPNNGQPSMIGQQAIGSIGLIGSGADLEMADVNIITGDSYRISAMKLEFPTSWTF